MKTAEELFNERLKETGLDKEWNGFGRVATEEKDGSIILFVHEDTYDQFSEIHYPSFNELKNDKKFVEKCFNELDIDEEELRKLGMWLTGLTDKCPLYPLDAYWTADHAHTYYRNFIDQGITPWEYFGSRLKLYMNRDINLDLEPMEMLRDSVERAKKDVILASMVYSDYEYSFVKIIIETACDYLGSFMDYKMVVLDANSKPHCNPKTKRLVIYSDIKYAANAFVHGSDTAIMTLKEYCTLFNVNILELKTDTEK